MSDDPTTNPIVLIGEACRAHEAGDRLRVAALRVQFVALADQEHALRRHRPDLLADSPPVYEPFVGVFDILMSDGAAAAMDRVVDILNESFYPTGGSSL